MAYIRLYVDILPWQAAQNAGKFAPLSEELTKPWTEPCDPDLTIQGLAEKLAASFERLFPDKGKLRIKYLLDGQHCLLDGSHLVGQIFRDRGPGVDKSEWTVHVARLPPDLKELQSRQRYSSIVPESSAHPNKRQSRYYIEGSSTTNKRRRLQGPALSDHDRPMLSREKNLRRSYHDDRSQILAGSPVISDSQRSPKAYQPYTYDTPSSLSQIGLCDLIPPSNVQSVVVPDSPTQLVGPSLRDHPNEEFDFDDPKSESPELENIYNVPPSNAGTPVFQSSLNHSDFHTFARPALPSPKEPTVRRNQSSGPSEHVDVPAMSPSVVGKLGSSKLPGIPASLESSIPKTSRKISDTPRSLQDIWEVVSTDAEGPQEASSIRYSRKRGLEGSRNGNLLPDELSHVQGPLKSRSKEAVPQSHDSDQPPLLATVQSQNLLPSPQNRHDQKPSSPEANKDCVEVDDVTSSPGGRLTLNGINAQLCSDQSSKQQFGSAELGDFQTQSESSNSSQKLNDEVDLPLVKGLPPIDQEVAETASGENTREKHKVIKRKREPNSTGIVVEGDKFRPTEKQTQPAKSKTDKDEHGNNQEIVTTKEKLVKGAKAEKKEYRIRELAEEKTEYNEPAKEKNITNEKMAKGKAMKEKQSSVKSKEEKRSKTEDIAKKQALQRAKDKEIPNQKAFREQSVPVKSRHQKGTRQDSQPLEQTKAEEVVESTVTRLGSSQRSKTSSKIKEREVDESGAKQETVTPNNQRKRPTNAPKNSTTKATKSSAVLAQAESSSRPTSSQPVTPSRTRKSSTPMIPGREKRKVLPPNNSGSSHATPSVNSNLETQTSLASAMRKPQMGSHRSVSFVDEPVNSLDYSKALSSKTSSQLPRDGREDSVAILSVQLDKEGNASKLQQKQLSFEAVPNRKPVHDKQRSVSQKPVWREEIVISSGEDSSVSSYYSNEEGASKGDDKKPSSTGPKMTRTSSSVERTKDNMKIPQKLKMLPPEKIGPVSDIKLNNLSASSSQSVDLGAVDRSALSESSSRSPARFTSHSASSSSASISGSKSGSESESDAETDSRSPSSSRSGSGEAESPRPSRSKHGVEQGLKQAGKVDHNAGFRNSPTASHSLSQTSQVSPSLPEGLSKGSKHVNQDSSDPVQKQLQRESEQSAQHFLNDHKPSMTPFSKSSSSQSYVTSPLAGLGRKGLKAAGSLFPSLTDFKTKSARPDSRKPSEVTPSIAPRAAEVAESSGSSSSDEDDSSETSDDESIKDANHPGNHVVNSLNQRNKKTTSKAAKGLLKIIKDNKRLQLKSSQ